MVFSDTAALRAAVSIFEAGDIVLVKIAERYLKKGYPFRAARNAVFRAPRAKERISLFCVGISLSDAYDAGTLDDAPELIAVFVSLQAEGLPGLDRYYLHCGFLVQREALEVSPRALFLLVVRKTFHTD